MIKKICIVTGTRAEFGQLSWLIDKINTDPEFTLQLIVTGMHLSPEFGSTFNEIIDAGYIITKKIEIQLSSDSSIGISKSMGLAQISFADAFDQLKPDLVVILGDRTEMLAIASSALVFGIPIAHIHGGEITEGVYDNSIRHAITKMSSLHFTSTEIYRNRVIQMGEDPKSVFNVGALAIESVLNLKLFTREEFEKSINHKLFSKNLLITFHPVTLENNSACEQFTQLLEALDELKDTLLIFTKPNSDKDGRIIIQLIDEYVQIHSKKAIAFTSLGQQRYLSAIPLMDAVVGNSSSGIMEVPALNIPTINVGDRQKGRIMGPTIFNCEPEKEAISKTINKAYQFDKSIRWDHPYGKGNTSSQILEILKNTGKINLKKTFYNIQPDKK